MDTFLTLLTTQLKNQDPLKPLDTEKFTSQLVQFASVEQSIQTNAHLEALIALQGASDLEAALSLVGREAGVASPVAMFDGSGAAWTYILPEDARSFSVTILDANGAVAARPAAVSTKGSHALLWDGALLNGEKAPPGLYTLKAEGVGADGAPLAVAVETTARVNAASFGESGAKLETSVGLIDLADIRRVAAE
jgi:flagellar basal-body rod modification protein FlgD